MSESNSTQSQASHFTDNRNVIGEGANNAQNGSSITTTSNSYVLDNGAIDRAFTTTDNTVGAAFDFGNRTLNFGSSALDFAGGAFDTAMGFADRTNGRALDFAGQAVADTLAAGAASSARAFNFGNDALSMADNAYGTAMAFGRNALEGALGNVQATQQLTANAYNDAKGRGALTDKIIIGAIGAMALVAFVALRAKG